MSRTICITAPSRLHFGLLSFGHAPFRQYGGVGVMVERPALELEITAADRFCALGSPEQEARIRAHAEYWLSKISARISLPACQIRVAHGPRFHRGLGSGTQLALSVALGLNHWCGLRPPSPAELARQTGRGQRSAVGTYGFYLGGLIAERGKSADEQLAPLDRRVALPSSWQFLILTPHRCGEGLSGAQESGAFAALPPSSVATEVEMRRELHERLLPAAVAGDPEAFGESLYRYGILAGSLYATVQTGGAFAQPQLAKWIDLMRELGLQGVGQTSWGPSLFALIADGSSADRWLRELRAQIPRDQAEIFLTPINHSGVRLSVSGPTLPSRA